MGKFNITKNIKIYLALKIKENIVIFIINWVLYKIMIVLLKINLNFNLLHIFLEIKFINYNN